MKRVLLTGGAGFIGANCIDSLLRRGFDVHAISRRTKTRDAAPITWHTADLDDHQKVQRLCAGIRAGYLLHLAWTVGHGEFWSSPQNLDCVASSLNLIRTFTESGGHRIVCAGTCAEYRWDDTICNEQSTPLIPESLYGVSKDALRRVLESFAAVKTVSWAWGRMFLVYGPREDSRRFVPQLITSLLAHREAHCLAATHARDLIHAADLGGILAALLDSNLQGPINLASGEPVTLGSVAEKIACKIGRPDLLRMDSSQNGPHALLADVRLLSLLDWRRKYTLDSGLDDTIQWWKKALG